MYRLTDDGRKTAMTVISEFCHGFNIEEIANNSDFEADEIKVILMVLLADAGVIEMPDFEAIDDEG